MSDSPSEPLPCDHLVLSLPSKEGADGQLYLPSQSASNPQETKGGEEPYPISLKISASFSQPIQEKTLQSLGLGSFHQLPRDRAALAKFLKGDDRTDRRADDDSLARGIRRAIRLSVAVAAGLHKLEGKNTREWAAENYGAGVYETYNRYIVAAGLQIGLLDRGLPPLTNLHQARVLAPFRREEKFWDALIEGAQGPFKNGYPAAHLLKAFLAEKLRLKGEEKHPDPKFRIVEQLRRLAGATSELESDDPSIEMAGKHIAKAIAALNAKPRVKAGAPSSTKALSELETFNLRELF